MRGITRIRWLDGDIVVKEVSVSEGATVAAIKELIDSVRDELGSDFAGRIQVLTQPSDA